MEQENWHNDCQSGLRRDGGVQVMGWDVWEKKGLRTTRMVGKQVKSEREKRSDSEQMVTATERRTMPMMRNHVHRPHLARLSYQRLGL